ncbi:actin-binding WH2 domain-containing protein [bacterium]|nr:actin-binding WH2 domain-containing protein [bacterium]
MRLAYLSIWWEGLLDPAKAVALIRGDPSVTGFGRWLLIIVFFMLAIYGVSMGLFNSGLAAAVSAVKLPLLYLCTLLVCFPALYVFNHQSGPRLTVRQTGRLLLMAVSVNAVALCSFAPVGYFFVLTTSRDGYEFLVLMHVAVFGFAGAISIGVVAHLFSAVCQATGRALRWQFLLSWAFLYMLVGTQMSWALRPWFGAAGIEYEILRGREGSFIQAVWGLLH